MMTVRDVFPDVHSSLTPKFPRTNYELKVMETYFKYLNKFINPDSTL